jgi:hypothetical protein
VMLPVPDRAARRDSVGPGRSRTKESPALYARLMSLLGLARTFVASCIVYEDALVWCSPMLDMLRKSY